MVGLRRNLKAEPVAKVTRLSLGLLALVRKRGSREKSKPVLSLKLPMGRMLSC